jgi:hypothetical protein
MINSFVFLDNHYPSVYPGNKLIPGNNPNQATQWFSTAGWDGPNGHREGYYTRVTPPFRGDADAVLLQTKKDWVNDWAPGTTRFESMLKSGGTYPTIEFLANEICHHEDVELAVDIAPIGAHLITLTAISCDMAGNCKIRYQDPNDPQHEQPAVDLFTSHTIDHPNELFFYFKAFGGSAFIRSAFAESPVPEPPTWLLFFTALSTAPIRKLLRASD